MSTNSATEIAGGPEGTGVVLYAIEQMLSHDVASLAWRFFQFEGAVNPDLHTAPRRLLLSTQYLHCHH